jgi:hypothetical protein
MQRYVAEFVALMPDVIVSGDPPTVDAIKKGPRAAVYPRSMRSPISLGRAA